MLLPLIQLFMFIISICSLSFMLMIVSRPRSLLVFTVPLIPSTIPVCMVCPSIHPPCTRVSIHGQSDFLSLVLPSFDFFYLPLASHLIGIPFLVLCRVVLSLSQLHGTVSTSGPLVRTAVKYDIFNHQQCYSPTSDSKYDI